MTARTWQLGPMTGTTLNANDRPHWRVRHRVTKEWRELAAGLARSASIPRLERASILVEWLPPDKGRRDPNNVAPMSKAIVDGIVDAGVLADDDAPHLDGPDHRLGPVTRPKLRVPKTTALLVTITEAPPA